MQKTIYYDSFADDLVRSSEQDIALPADYRFVRRGFWNRLADRLVLLGVRVFGFFYVRLWLMVRFYGRHRLWRYRRAGYFLYANHTQAVADPFITALACVGARPYGIVSAANFGIPVIGRLMPWMGALPVIPTLKGRQSLAEAVCEHIEQHHPVAIYPEAHVWNYYTHIRPFSAAAFGYPADTQVPCFAMTTVYRRPLWGKRPRIEVYIDGPFRAETGLPLREQRQRLCTTIRHALEMRATQSNYEYVRYEQRTNNQSVKS